MLVQEVELSGLTGIVIDRQVNPCRDRLGVGAPNYSGVPFRLVLLRHRDCLIDSCRNARRTNITKSAQSLPPYLKKAATLVLINISIQHF